ncbi:TetR/AcrR family transcriptional regulator [Nonomuraea sp. NPDC049695]|uniref:TetR/AcrR family transcriptional regulator n=1 Tax=Nonomuraea sp. NPDC049695 TaxID=3154734 RepID=UPI00341B52F2
MTPPSARNLRADALRSKAAILDAALEVLEARPDASLDAIAAAAEVTRQTVYAHFRSRDQLLTAVVDRLTEETAAAMNATDPDTGPAAEALLRVLDAAERTVGRYPVLARLAGSLPAGPRADRERHEPISELLVRVIRRGQQAGEFDDRLPPDWLATVTIKLAHAASEETGSGRMTQEESRRALHTTLLLALGGTARS